MPVLPVSRNGRTAIEVATRAIRRGGGVLLTHAGCDIGVRDKGPNNPVTDADFLSEDAIRNVISAEYPEAGILSEESAPETPLRGYTWIIDPLAGTGNYAAGIPLYAVNIALARDREILLGMTYEPVNDELFRAVKGEGAYLNDTPARVSERALLSEAVLGFDVGYDVAEGKRLLDRVSTLWPRVRGLKSLGSASLTLAYIACGRVDAYVRGSLRPWDIASGALLIEEAGGRVTDWQGKRAVLENRGILATNGHLHGELRKELK